jgi:tetratricopeptide (TPR) repeat protein
MRGVVEQSMWRALAHLEVRGDTARASARLAEARPFVAEAAATAKIMSAWVAAAVGQPEEARRILADYEATSSDFDLNRRPGEFWAAEGATLLAEGDIAGAARMLQRGHEEGMGRAFGCQFCPDMLLGRALDRLGELDKARLHYSEYANARWVFGPDREQDVAFLVPVRERLAQIYEEAGEYTRAAEQYREVLRQWASAYPALQPRLDSARAGLRRTAGS